MNIVNIVTEKGWIVRPDLTKTLADKKEGRIFRDNILARSEGAEQILEDCWSFKMLPGIMRLEDVESGHLAIIKAPQYIIANNRYDLAGYGIPCIINKYRGMFPLFRKAHMAEKFVYVDRELKEDFKANALEIQKSLIHTWPQVVSLEDELEDYEQGQVDFTLL